MRKALLLLAVVAALAGAGVAGAAISPSPNVACGPTCNGGPTGFTGCSSVTASHSASVTFLVSIRHYLVVSYCKQYGIITSISIAAHGCDAGGLGRCDPTQAWLTGGGVGSGWATFEAHATWYVLPNPLQGTDVLTLTVPAG